MTKSQVTKMEELRKLRKEFLNKFSQVTWGGEEWLGNKRPKDVFDWFISKLTLSESRVRGEMLGNKPQMLCMCCHKKFIAHDNSYSVCQDCSLTKKEGK